jgi:hypothetical protein
MEGSPTRKELQKLYNRSQKVINRWLKEAGITHRKSLTPADLEILYAKVGEPKRS